MDANQFNRNISNRPAEELTPYQGKHVAWSDDGLAVLAAADSEEALYEEIRREGLTCFVVGFVPAGDISYL